MRAKPTIDHWEHYEVEGGFDDTRSKTFYIVSDSGEDNNPDPHRAASDSRILEDQTGSEEHNDGWIVDDNDYEVAVIAEPYLADEVDYWNPDHHEATNRDGADFPMFADHVGSSSHYRSWDVDESGSEVAEAEEPYFMIPEEV